MRLNKQAVRNLMKERANNNYHELARMLGLDVAHVYRTLNQSEAGPKFLGALLGYCDRNKLRFKDYIFLDAPDENGNK